MTLADPSATREPELGRDSELDLEPDHRSRSDHESDPESDRESDHGPVDAHQHGYITDKARYLARLRRIEGQVRGVHRMIDEEKYCIDVLTQISALTRSLEGVALGLLDDHLRHCVVDAARESDTAAGDKIAEASAAISRLVRS